MHPNDPRRRFYKQREITLAPLESFPAKASTYQQIESQTTLAPPTFASDLPEIDMAEPMSDSAPQSSSAMQERSDHQVATSELDQLIRQIDQANAEAPRYENVKKAAPAFLLTSFGIELNLTERPRPTARGIPSQPTAIKGLPEVDSDDDEDSIDQYLYNTYDGKVGPPHVHVDRIMSTNRRVTRIQNLRNFLAHSETGTMHPRTTRSNDDGCVNYSFKRSTFPDVAISSYRPMIFPEDDIMDESA